MKKLTVGTLSAVLLIYVILHGTESALQSAVLVDTIASVKPDDQADLAQWQEDAFHALINNLPSFGSFAEKLDPYIQLESLDTLGFVGIFKGQEKKISLSDISFAMTSSDPVLDRYVDFSRLDYSSVYRGVDAGYDEIIGTADDTIFQSGENGNKKVDAIYILGLGVTANPTIEFLSLTGTFTYSSQSSGTFSDYETQITVPETVEYPAIAGIMLLSFSLWRTWRKN